MALRNLASRARLVPPGQAEGPFGIVRPLAALGVDLDPFLMMDWARGSEDPFGPHPHAGFSVSTYLFPDSEGKFLNRDSLGEDLLIEGDIFSADSGPTMNYETD